MALSMGGATSRSTQPAVGVPRQATGPRAAEHPCDGLTLLVIGPDPLDAVHLPELLRSDADPSTDRTSQDRQSAPVRVRTARNLTEAERLLTDEVHCILLDLAVCDGPPRAEPSAVSAGPVALASDEREGVVAGPQGPDGDTEGVGRPSWLRPLQRVLRMAPTQAVLVLSAEDDVARAAEAVRLGAQDYLCRNDLDGPVLRRAVRYAVERKRADVAQRQLTESRLRAQENARLERGLLPTPLLDGARLRFAARYRPGRSRALLGGDFYDTVRTPDGTVHAVIGDVCGHGPDEAALGVELRIAWRALTFAGLCGDALLGTLQRVLEHERASEEIFATLCTVDVAPDGRRAGLCLAGHPAPLVVPSGAAPRLLPQDEGGPALGLLPHARWPRTEVELGDDWSLMLYTDGLIEGRAGREGRRLGQEGMLDLVAAQVSEGRRGGELLDAVVAGARELNGEELTDDVAVLLLDRPERC